ncbi:MAG TPA: ATP-binding protein [Azospira sp.]|nr:ATP-binding protein [Azospira sp.]
MMPHRAFGIAVGYIALYLLLDWVSFIHPLPAFDVTPWNPPPGVSLALLLVFGLRFLPLVLGVVWAGEVIFKGAAALAPATFATALVLTAGYGVLAALLQRLDAGHIRTQGSLFRFIALTAVTVLTIGAVFVAVTATLADIPVQGMGAALVRFWIGDFIGILVTTPLLLTLVNRRDWQFLLSGEFALQVLAIAVSLGMVFGLPGADKTKLFYLLFLPLIWISLRQGLAGAVTTLALTQGGMILCLEWLGHKGSTVQEFQFLMLALTVTGLYLGVSVSARRALEAKLEQALRLAAAGEMASALAHELGQPLTALSNYARAGQLMLDAGGSATEGIAEVLDKVTAESRRAGDVVRRLRDFFRNGQIRQDPVDLGAVARETVASMDALAREQGSRLEYAISQDLPLIRGDTVQLQVVLRNLLANALEAVASQPESGVVTLAVVQEGEEVVVRVHDNGPGIAPCFRERLFKPFATSKPAGMGLGLAISRAIADAHGGRLWADSPARGGSVFALALPAAQF